MSLSMLNVCCVLNVFLLFFSLFYMGALTKRPLFILFCQQPKRRGECPPNAIIQSTPPQRYTCFPLSKTDNFSSCDTEPFSRLFLSSPLPFPSFFLFFFYSPFPFTFARETTPSRHERFHETNSVFLFRGYLFRFRSSAAHAIPCQSQGSARLNATSRYESPKKSAKCGTPPHPLRPRNKTKRAQEIARSDLRTLDD